MIHPLAFLWFCASQSFGWSCELHSGDNTDLSVTVKIISLKDFIVKALFLVLAEQRREKEHSFRKHGFGTASMSGIDREFP